MKAETLHIKKPSKELLTFVRQLRSDKENNKAKVLANKELYFSKK